MKYELKDLENVYEIEVIRKNGTIIVFKNVFLGVSDALKYGEGEVLAYRTNLNYDLMDDFGNCPVSVMMDGLNHRDNVEVIINPQHDRACDEYE